MPNIVPHLRSVVDQDGAVILDVEHDAILTLNPTGGYIWERLQRGELIEEIIDDLSRDTGMEVAVVERDVRDFLEDLKSRHLLAGARQETSSGLLKRLRVPWTR